MAKRYDDAGPRDDDEECPDCDEELCNRCAAGVAYRLIHAHFFAPTYGFEQRTELAELFQPRKLLAAPNTKGNCHASAL